jgi:hypothetical protein
MPVNNYNPVLSGITNAMSIANLMHRAQVEDQQLALAKQRMIQDQQQHEQAAQYNDVRVQEMLNNSARPVVGGTVEDQVPDVPGLVGAGMTIRRKPDAGRAVKYKTRSGEQLEYELLTPEEQAGRSMRAKLAEAQGMEGMRQAAALEGARTKLQTFGLEVTPEMAKYTGMKAGSRFMPEQLDDVMRTVYSGRAAEQDPVTHAIPVYGQQGTSLVTVTRGGKINEGQLAVGPRPYAWQRPREETPASKRAGEKTQRDQQITSVASMAMMRAKNAEEARAALDQLGVQSEFVKSNYADILKKINGSYQRPNANDPAAIAAALDEALGGKKPEGSAGGPKKATKGPINGDKIRAYAIAKTKAGKPTDYNQAKKEFEQFGYDVSGAR